MNGCLALVLHAHLPFVRHPEYERSLEETWLFEAITETYVPLLRLLESWRQAGLDAPLTLTLSPTLCAMLRDPFLQGRYLRHLEALIELAGKEVHRTVCDPALQEMARFYVGRFKTTRDFFLDRGGDLVAVFRALQDQGRIEIITTAATHGLLPLLAGHPPSVRGQILAARDDYRAYFGRDPRGIWLPECASEPGIEVFLREAGLRWFAADSHGLLNADPRPRYSVYAPILTPNGLAVFGRDPQSAKQVWSRHEGYPGDPRYRDFYRDIGFDLDLDYLQPYLPCVGQRSFTGIKYHRITDQSAAKGVYDRRSALEAADGHAAHFLNARLSQIQSLGDLLDGPPLVFCPYDAELFGHWWHEGPEFLDSFVRRACRDQQVFTLTTPEAFLCRYPTHQVATPAASSWGEDGYWKAWLNEKNHWVHPHLHVAERRMTNMAERFLQPSPLQHRALRQAARELLLAQASDWLFILSTGTSPEYATRRIKDHLLCFTTLYEQFTSGALDESWLAQVEARDNLFPNLDWRYWIGTGVGDSGENRGGGTK